MCHGFQFLGGYSPGPGEPVHNPRTIGSSRWLQSKGSDIYVFAMAILQCEYIHRTKMTMGGQVHCFRCILLACPSLHRVSFHEYGPADVTGHSTRQTGKLRGDGVDKLNQEHADCR